MIGAFRVRSTFSRSQQLCDCVTEAMLMTKYFRYLTILVLFSCPLGARTLYGPRSFGQGLGAPQSYIETFSANPSENCGGRLQFVLTVENISGLVSSATVSLNGIVIMRESDFPGPVSRDFIVTLTATNTIAVTMKGGPPSSE